MGKMRSEETDTGSGTDMGKAETGAETGVLCGKAVAGCTPGDGNLIPTTPGASEHSENLGQTSWWRRQRDVKHKPCPLRSNTAVSILFFPTDSLLCLSQTWRQGLMKLRLASSTFRS